jgi:predicted nucleotidyltransferase
MKESKMGVDAILHEKREDILRIANKHGVNSIRVFGSAARGESREDSDIDFLIEVGGSTSPWFPGGLVAELEELLGRHVDLVESDAIRESLRESVLSGAVSL